MKSMRAITLELLLVTGLTLMGCSSEMSSRGDTGWITLLDGSNPKTLENWNRIGDANWTSQGWRHRGRQRQGRPSGLEEFV